jgi:hypothetical protein
MGLSPRYILFLARRAGFAAQCKALLKSRAMRMLVADFSWGAK